MTSHVLFQISVPALTDMTFVNGETRLTEDYKWQISQNTEEAKHTLHWESSYLKSVPAGSEIHVGDISALGN